MTCTRPAPANYTLTDFARATRPDYDAMARMALSEIVNDMLDRPPLSRRERMMAGLREARWRIATAYRVLTTGDADA